MGKLIIHKTTQYLNGWVSYAWSQLSKHKGTLGY